MTVSAPLLRLALCGLLLSACDRASRDVAGPDLAARSMPDARATVASAGVTKASITGTIVQLGTSAPGRNFATPSGQCHFWDWQNYTEFTGDVAGLVTFNEKVHAPCDLSSLQASGPVSGEVTWQGRTGPISGQWTTNCRPDATQPAGLSCGGTFNVRGSEGLEGVQFHFDWGPGWFPFQYTGTAFSQ
jgi:hypothetical protein